jgi:tetratricopeptide (TPR) repeat protein
MRWAALGVAMFLVLGLPSPAAADPLRERAQQEFAAGRVEFEAGRYDAALEHLQRAYALAPHPELLFNIARCLEELHRSGAAIDAYDRYLAVEPNDSVARDRAAALRQRLLANPPPATESTAQPSPTPAATPSAPTTTTTNLLATAPPPRRPLYRRWWLWTTVGAVVVVGAGVGLAVALTRPSTPSAFPPLTAQ